MEPQGRWEKPLIYEGSHVRDLVGLPFAIEKRVYSLAERLTGRPVGRNRLNQRVAVDSAVLVKEILALPRQVLVREVKWAIQIPQVHIPEVLK